MLSSGFAGRAAASAARAMTSGPSGSPTSDARRLRHFARSRGHGAENDPGVAAHAALEPHRRRHSQHREVERPSPPELPVGGAPAVDRGQAELRQDLVGGLAEVLDAVVPEELRDRESGARPPGRRASPGRPAPTAPAPCRKTRPPSSGYCPAPPDRCRRPSSCKSRSPGATRTTGCSSCSACRRRRCPRASPCCGAGASRPRRPPAREPGSGRRPRGAPRRA